MTISVKEVQLTIVKPQNGLVAFASCSINNCFYLGNIALYSSPSHHLGFRTVFPTKKLSSGQQIPCFYPFKKEVEEVMTTTIVNKYFELINNLKPVEEKKD